jgi:hypothetical protein
MRETSVQTERFESEYELAIHVYAEKALELTSQYKWPHNVWTAINYERGPDRVKIFRDVLVEAKKRVHQKRRLKTVSEPTETSWWKAPHIIAGAIAHERLHPKDAYDNSYDTDE